MHVLSGLGGFQESLTCKNCLQQQKCLGIKDKIWLIQSYLTQHHQLVILRRRSLICTWVHLSTSYTPRVAKTSGFLGLHIYTLFKLIIYSYQFLGTR